MLKVERLRCEYLENPLGIGEKKTRFSWILASKEKNVMQTSYQIQVSKSKNGFENPYWDSGVVSSDNSVHVCYEGPALSSRTRYYYRVRVTDNKNNNSDWSETGFFETALLDNNEWKAHFISHIIKEDTKTSSSCPLMRKEFEVKGDVSHARAYVTSLGLYELRLNGEKAGDAVLAPGWTSYNKRLQYQTIDVTPMLKKGTNTVGAILGKGWYNGLSDRPNHIRKAYGKENAFSLQLHITYTNGEEQVLITDESWKSSSGPILMSEIYNGETYDARLEIPGWDLPGFDDGSWTNVKILEVDKSILVAQDGVPVKKIENVKPISMFRTPKGETVIDMGQNMVGWIHFRVSGKRGSRVVLKHAEVLDKDGNFYTENLRTAKQTVEYILKGDSEESYEPHFTFQGFRYVKIEEFPGEPRLDNFTGVVIHSEMDKTGEFSCSNELVNQLQHNILWSQKGNFVDVPTDCPQRDERLGWTGDAQVFIRTACFNMNSALFFRKWLRDLKADQLDNGGVPHVIPHVLREGSDSSCGWGDAAVICPWTLYLCYGDLRILEEQYDSMKAWVEYIRSRAENGLIWNTGHHFSDWLALDAKEGSYYGATPDDFCATAFYAYSTELLAKTASILNKPEDAKTYSKLHSDIVQAFRNEFFTPTGRLAVPTQTAHVLALMFNLVDEKNRKRTIDTLVKYLEKNDWHLTTGFLGTPYLCHVLSSNGYNDVAYRLLLQTDYPSWLYQITKGATTIWEHWDGIKPDGSFWSSRMNSFNHYAYGSIGDWLYRVVAGIDTDESIPGYKRIVIKPQPSKQLQWASACYDSMYGRIESKWSMTDGIFKISVTIPHNTTALVVLPYAKTDDLMKNDVIAENPALKSQISECDGSVQLELGSGTYTFSYPVQVETLQ